jgi:hypothetical protein
MMEGIVAANPQTLVFALLILGGSIMRPGARVPATAPNVWRTAAKRMSPIARALAAALKVYALIPVIARREWRAVTPLAILLVLSVVTSADLWMRYLTEFGSISSRIVTESEGGTSAALFLRPSVFSTLLPGEGLATAAGLLVYGLIALLLLLAAVRDVAGAGWIAAPLLFPAAEYHLATMAIPAARRLAIWVIAVPTIPTYLLGLIVLTYQVTAGQRALVAGDQPAEPLSRWLASLRPRVARVRTARTP